MAAVYQPTMTEQEMKASYIHGGDRKPGCGFNQRVTFSSCKPGNMTRVYFLKDGLTFQQQQDVTRFLEKMVNRFWYGK